MIVTGKMQKFKIRERRFKSAGWIKFRSARWRSASIAWHDSRLVRPTNCHGNTCEFEQKIVPMVLHQQHA
jgi:hypothetical protein